MSTDPLNAFAYILIADNFTIAYLKQAMFPTAYSFEFETPLFMDQRLLDSLSNRGYLPFHRWSLITLDFALREVGRVVWNHARMARIRFPALNNQSPTPLRSLVRMAVAGVREVDPVDGAGIFNTAGSHHLQIAASYFFGLKIDGLESVSFSVSKIDAFYIGDGVSQDLVLTIVPEANADPYRDWLRNGNTPRGGSLNFLDLSLRTFFTVRFKGLRVRTVTPAFTIHSPNPATVRLMYSDIRFR